MGYFWVNQAQEYLQSLGFGSTCPGIVKQPFDVKITSSAETTPTRPTTFRIRLGKGGVDDAEDAEVIVHEYGHAVHQTQVPGYGGASTQARSVSRSATTSR